MRSLCSVPFDCTSCLCDLTVMHKLHVQLAVSMCLILLYYGQILVSYPHACMYVSTLSYEKNTTADDLMCVCHALAERSSKGSLILDITAVGVLLLLLCSSRQPAGLQDDRFRNKRTILSFCRSHHHALGPPPRCHSW